MKRQQKLKLAFDAMMMFYPFTTADLDGECWKTIVGFEDYQISTFGRVKSLKWGKQKILRPFLEKNGYLHVRFLKGKDTKRAIHRLVAKAFLPNPYGKETVNHLNGRFNNYVGCLEWATQSENVQHALRVGLKVAPKGEDVYNAKFTNEQVRYMRDNPDGLSIEELAKMFNTTTDKINRIQRGGIYENAGGNIRKPKFSKVARVDDGIRKEIYERYKTSGISQRELAKQYNLSQATINKIIHER